MKNRILFALPLAAMFAFPAFAQTTSSTDQSATTTSQSAATGKQPLQAPSREGFWGRVNPFARKKYVQRQTEPIRDRACGHVGGEPAVRGGDVEAGDGLLQAPVGLTAELPAVLAEATAAFVDVARDAVAGALELIGFVGAVEAENGDRLAKGADVVEGEVVGVEAHGESSR